MKFPILIRKLHTMQCCFAYLYFLSFAGGASAQTTFGNEGLTTQEGRSYSCQVLQVECDEWQAKTTSWQTDTLMGGANQSLSTKTGEDQPSGTSDILSTSKTNSEQPISFRDFGLNLVQGQKTIWLFPARVAHGEHWKPALALTAATGAFIALDPRDEPYFVNSSGFNNFKTGILRGRNTTLLIASVPLTTYLVGRTMHRNYARNTALLAAESIIDAQIVAMGMKAITGRRFPSDIPPHGDFTHTWFKYEGSLSNPGSFPSGHSTMAFAAASVFARRYHEHRWVPWVAYGLATFVGLSRIPDRAHYPSDVFVGAALGYVVGQYVIKPPTQ